MLLVGGGVGPPVIGILAGVSGLGNNTRFGRWVKHRSVNRKRFLALMWPWILIIAVIDGIFLVIGSLVLVYIFDVNNPGLFSNSFFIVGLLMLFLIVTQHAYDIQKDRGDCV